MACFAHVVLISLIAAVPASLAWAPGVCVCNCCAQCNDIHLAGSFHTARSSNCTTLNCGKKLPSECPVYLYGGWGRNEPTFVSTGVVAQLNLVANSLSSSCTTQYPELAGCFSGYLATQTQGLATLISTSQSQSNCPVGNLTVAGTSGSGAFATDGTTIIAGQASSKVLTVTYGGGCTAQYTVDPASTGSFLGVQPSAGNTASSTTSTGSDSSCFPASVKAHVQLEDGSLLARRMDELAVGDKVLVFTASGKLAYEDIFMFSHQSPELSSFIQLVTSDGSSISLSPDHYIHVLPAGSDSPTIVTAARVKLGDQLRTTSSFQSDTELQWSTVLSSRQVSMQGLYNPHTASGTIVVESVLACTFPNSLPPSIAAHTAATMPARVLYNLIPSKSAAVLLNKLLLHLYFTTVSGSRQILSGLISAAKV